MTSHCSTRDEASVLDEATLVDQLNTLLSSLNIPITLISPTDLTPSLLIAILESMLSMRIPLIDRSPESKHFKSSKIHNMKIFLGFLEIDILKTDVGLSDVNPRRLADGELGEVTILAELLCWMGRRKGLIPRHQKPGQETIIPKRPHNSGSPPLITPLSPKSQLDLDAISVFQTGSTATGSTRPSTHLFSSFVKDTDKESITTANTSGDPYEENGFGSYDGSSDDLSDILSALPPFEKSQPPARCIHEVPSPSVLFSRAPEPRSRTPTSQPKRSQPLRLSPKKDIFSITQSASASSHDHFYGQYEQSLDQSNTSVRYTGFIEPVDEESEIASFELSRSLSFKDMSFAGQQSRSPVKLETFKEQYARTRELLHERARLLNQLAELKLSNG